MHDDRAVLNAGEFLQGQALVSPSGAYALEHRFDGTVAMRDTLTSRDVWQLGAQGEQFSLLVEGYLALTDGNGRVVWTSGGVDRRVVAATVTDDGRLLLVDPDGRPRWTRDLLTDADLADYRPAGSDRLQRGEVLTDAITSPNGKYRLSHAPTGETTLRTSDRGVWSRRVGVPGAAISLGRDGVLRVGTDSMVLLRWTGRSLLDPLAYTISALVVRDRGDFVLLGEDGTELFDSETAAEEARLAKLNRDYARKQAENDAKPTRPAGMSRDWFDALELDGPYTLSLVTGVDARDALIRLGAGAETITPMTYADIVAAAFPDDEGEPIKCALAVPIDEWIMLIEPCGIEGMERGPELSERTQAVIYHQGHDGNQFLAWYRNGEALAVYNDDDDYELLESVGPAPDGTEPAVLVPLMKQIGLGKYQENETDFLQPPLEVACLAAGVTPRPEHFAGRLLGAVFGTW